MNRPLLRSRDGLNALHRALFGLPRVGLDPRRPACAVRRAFPGAAAALLCLSVCAPAQDSPFAGLEEQRDASPGAAEQAVPAAEEPVAGSAPAAEPEAEAPTGNGPPPGAAAHGSRDPFWPVGWSPPVFGPPKAETPMRKTSLIKWDEAAKQLRVTGVFRKGDKHLAVVKGVGVVETGDVVAVQYGDLTYRWVVKSIDARGIVPARLDVFPTNQPR